MKYQKTIDLWADGNEEKIRTGELVLQSGQWVTCGNGIKSRFVATNGCTIHVAHGRDNTEVRKCYLIRAATHRQAKALGRGYYRQAS